MANTHVLNAMQRAIWSILPDALEQITQIVLDHDQGERFSLSELEARAGRKLENSHAPYVRDGVGVIPIYGPLVKRANLFSAVSAMTSTELLHRDFKLFLEDDDIRGILLDVDSPGGTVDGLKLLRDSVFEAREVKPVISFANGMMASAAYWLGSAAGAVVVEPTAMTGSIGVIAMHVDRSESDKKAGIKRTVLTSGRYKAMGNDAEPLSKQGREYMQKQLDYYYSLFARDVAENRSVSVETVLSSMADGRVFIGEQALEVGLVDEVGTFDRALELAKNAAAQGTEGSSSSGEARGAGGFSLRGGRYQVSSMEGERTGKDAGKGDGKNVFNQFNNMEDEEMISEETNKSLANYIGKEALANSSIPKEVAESLALPGFADYVEAENGQLDTQEYKRAVADFVHQIEAKINPEPQVLGGAGGSRPFNLSGSLGPVDDEEKAEALLVDEMLALAESGKANLEGGTSHKEAAVQLDDLGELAHEDPAAIASHFGIAEEDALIVQMLLFSSDQRNDAVSFLRECRLLINANGGGNHGKSS